LTTVLIILLIALTAVLVAVMVARPGLTATRGGKVMAFLVLFPLPGLCVGMGGAAQFEHSKSTKFCLSCHIMEPYGRSLRIDDPGRSFCSYLSASRSWERARCCISIRLFRFANRLQVLQFLIYNLTVSTGQEAPQMTWCALV
jgi:hypothetical protein